MNSNGIWSRDRESPVDGRRMGWRERGRSLATRSLEKGRRPLVFGTLVAFSFLYYYRPEDFIPGLEYIPMAKITAFIAVAGLIFGGMSGGGRMKVPWAVRFLWLLLFQMALCVPTAIWRGGAFWTTFDFSKGVIVAMLISMAVVKLWEIRRLLFIQVSAVAIVTVISVLIHHHNKDGRLTGIQNGILENPNDLAINIAVSFPLGVAFMLRAKGLKKALWGIALVFMALGIVMSYSRSGLLAFICTLIICIWEYGVKGKRMHIVLVTAVAMVVGMGAALTTSHYRARVASIVMGNIEGSGDKGSLEARKALLKKSLLVAAEHPIFGVGPGCFVIVDSGWVVAHNTYTELAAEEGFAALLLFLLAMGAALRNIALVKKSQQYQENPEFQILTQALWAGLVAYLIAAMFASTEYNMYPYFLLGYTCAMVRIMGQPASETQSSRVRSLSRTIYDRMPRPEPSYR
jgi:O-antigen ligase